MAQVATLVPSDFIPPVPLADLTLPRPWRTLPRLKPVRPLCGEVAIGRICSRVPSGMVQQV